MKIEMPGVGTVVEIDDEKVREYARTMLNMKTLDDDIEKLVEARVQRGLQIMIENDPEEVMDSISEADFKAYAEDAYEMMTAEDFADDWTNWVDDFAIQDYARDQFNMMTEDDAIEYAKDKLDS